MGQRLKKGRCSHCRMLPAVCFCDEIPRIEIATRVVLVAHTREIRKPTNTGRLALLALNDCELHVRGRQDQPADLSGIPMAGRRTWLLFPSKDAVVLSRQLVESDARPITLLVPDGTWGQARRAVRREPVLVGARKITLPANDRPSRYRLRREVLPGGLATAEAISRALGIIEGEHVQLAMEKLFDTMVERVLKGRGNRRPIPPLPT